jgi:hypothetical protein
LWTHSSVFEVYNNIRNEDIEELEATAAYLPKRHEGKSAEFAAQ